VAAVSFPVALCWVYALYSHTHALCWKLSVCFICLLLEGRRNPPLESSLPWNVVQNASHQTRHSCSSSCPWNLWIPQMHFLCNHPSALPRQHSLQPYANAQLSSLFQYFMPESAKILPSPWECLTITALYLEEYTQCPTWTLKVTALRKHSWTPSDSSDPAVLLCFSTIMLTVGSTPFGRPTWLRCEHLEDGSVPLPLLCPQSSAWPEQLCSPYLFYEWKLGRNGWILTWTLTFLGRYLHEEIIYFTLQHMGLSSNLMGNRNFPSKKH
jgi:hypothetical protein